MNGSIFRPMPGSVPARARFHGPCDGAKLGSPGFSLSPKRPPPLSAERPCEAPLTLLGSLLYVVFVVLVAMLWRRMWGLSSEQLFERAAQAHHLVLAVTHVHPRGGHWQQHQRWPAEQARESQPH